MIKNVLMLLMCGITLFAAAQEKGEGIGTYNFGKLKITAIQDVPSTFPISLFRGAEMSKLEQLVPSGKMDGSVNVFVLQYDGKNILVDTGNGARRGLMMPRLKEAGIKTESIDTVLLTHMHNDHIGGLILLGRAVFPKAEVYVSEPEYNYWKDSKSKVAHDVLRIYGKRIKTFKPNTEVLPGIMALDAPGHTPGHTVYELDSIMIIGDLLHAAALQFANPELCPTYDMDMEKAVKTRIEFYDKAVKSGKTVAGMHLPFPGVGVISKDKDGKYVFTEKASDEAVKKAAERAKAAKEEEEDDEEED